MTEQELQSIIADIQASSRECEWIEIKNNNSNPEMIGEYLSALSNGAAYVGKAKGFLVFGLDDKTHKITGTNFNPQKERIKNQEIENWLATLLNPRIDFSIHEIYIQGKRVVLFIVDSAGNIPVKFKDTAWIRIGSYKKRLSEHPERERKIWQNGQKQTFESKIAKNGLSADEVLELLDYPAVFKLLHFPLPDNKTAILDKLTSEKIISKRPSCYNITNLGAILFAEDLRNFDLLARKAVRVVFYRDKDRIHTLREYETWKGYAAGFEDLADFINSSLPVNEEIGMVLRKSTPIYPPIAVREFIANALIHQDFSLGGASPMIEVFKNRLEITNPGKPLIDILRFIDHPPLSRNETMASMMRRMNFCEERGSGIDRALTACEFYQLPAPKFTEGDLFIKVVMNAPQTLRQMSREDKIRACYQHCCLRYVAGEKMTNESLRNRLNIRQENYSTASRIIADTISANLIKLASENQSRKFAHYIPKWA